MARQRVTIELEVVERGMERLKDLQGEISQLAEKAKKLASGARGATAGTIALGAAGAAAAVGIAAVAAAATAGAVAFLKLVGTYGDWIKANNEQVESSKSLVQQLRANNELSAANVESIKAMADQISDTARISDEGAERLAKFSLELGNSTSETLRLVPASVSLSKALGVDFKTALKELSGTLRGNRSALLDQLPALRNLTTEQLKTGDAVAKVSKLFADMAEKDLDTFEGAVETNADLVKDFRAQIGELVKVGMRPFIDATNTVVGKLNELFEAYKPQIFEAFRKGLLVITQTLGFLVRHTVSAGLRMVETWSIVKTAVIQVVTLAFAPFIRTLARVARAIAAWAPAGSRMQKWAISAASSIQKAAEGLEDYAKKSVQGREKLLAMTQGIRDFTDQVTGSTINAVRNLTLEQDKYTDSVGRTRREGEKWLEQLEDQKRRLEELRKQKKRTADQSSNGGGGGGGQGGGGQRERSPTDSAGRGEFLSDFTKELGPKFTFGLDSNVVDIDRSNPAFARSLEGLKRLMLSLPSGIANTLQQALQAARGGDVGAVENIARILRQQADVAGQGMTTANVLAAEKFDRAAGALETFVRQFGGGGGGLGLGGGGLRLVINGNELEGQLVTVRERNDGRPF